ncbi:unnamed protein product [Notodromas monacha]|uniref:Uncharacterized protein n=1 Tax=Notodromas monacha TaxID=399045 RepID=A0A7R9BMU8_9CRUS|nr:unnamed protein product [Notodromas monacha]CAG0917040.1 unnamed protein product [Notodromas monacha]
MVTVNGFNGDKTDQTPLTPRPGDRMPIHSWLASSALASQAIGGMGNLGGSGLPFPGAPFAPTAPLDLPAVRDEYLRLWQESVLAQQHAQQQHSGLTTSLTPETYHFVSRLLAATPAYFYEPFDTTRTGGNFFSNLLKNMVAKWKSSEEASNSSETSAVSSERVRNEVKQEPETKRPRMEQAVSLRRVEESTPDHDVKRTDPESASKKTGVPIVKPIPVPPLPVMPRFLQTPSFKLGVPAMTLSEPENFRKRKAQAEDASTDGENSTTMSAFQPFANTSESGAEDEPKTSSDHSPSKVLKNLKNIYSAVQGSSQ